LERLSGVKAVSARCDPKSWTAVIHLKDVALPDLKTWRQEFRAVVGESFALVGVEAAIDGQLVEVNGAPALKVSGSNVVLRLEPLKQKVQWDPERKCPQEPTREEKEAHRRLADRWAGSGRPPAKVRIVGPLREPTPGGLPILTVREFTWH
jgi:hypothetical protein